MGFHFLPLDQIIKNGYETKMHAHISDIEGKPAETILQHTTLCREYFVRIAKDKQLIGQLQRFEKAWEMSKAQAQLFEQMLIDVITFHDVGKINDRFQKEKMKNCGDWPKLGFSRAHHSPISAMLYLAYYNGKFKQLEDQEQTSWLKKILFFNAYVIFKHHGSLHSPMDFFKQFKEPTSDMVRVIGQIGDEESALSQVVHTESLKTTKNYFNEFRCCVQKEDNLSDQRAIERYIYVKLVYSILTACDYYATSEYESCVKIDAFGSATFGEQLKNVFERSEITRKIREYEKDDHRRNGIFSAKPSQQTMNALRSELFLQAQKQALKHKDQRVFFLEAPTGSGKSNAAINLSIQWICDRQNELKKIFYVYPFNTLVEQNLDVLERVFAGGDESDKQVLEESIAVVNSITPMKGSEKDSSEETDEPDGERYQKILLNRQFLNYPLILTTHVSFFDLLFGKGRTSMFGFLQLKDSVVVLDEIQAYKSDRWAEIIIFLQAFAQTLNMRVLIMSATLPNLDCFLEQTDQKTQQVVRLIPDKQKYFKHPVFKDRVKVSFELLENKTINRQQLLERVLKENAKAGGFKKILVEFISKKSAMEFYELLKGQQSINRDKTDVQLLTGYDNIADRKMIIERTKKDGRGMILVATQVIEAGVDIDMDIGFKDISKLDSEEQFLGRINRSCKKAGQAYFFNMDKTERIYKDVGGVNIKSTLANKEMWEFLEQKEFDRYYMEKILPVLAKNAENKSDGAIEFFHKEVAKLNFKNIADRMRMMDTDNWQVTVFFNRGEIQTDAFGTINASEVWNEYQELLEDRRMEYAKKKVCLSGVWARMNFFIYQLPKCVFKRCVSAYSDMIGEIVYLDEKQSEAFFDRQGKFTISEAEELFL